MNEKLIVSEQSGEVNQAYAAELQEMLRTDQEMGSEAIGDNSHFDKSKDFLTLHTISLQTYIFLTTYVNTSFSKMYICASYCTKVRKS